MFGGLHRLNMTAPLNKLGFPFTSNCRVSTSSSSHFAHSLFDGVVGLVGLSLGKGGELEDSERPLGEETLLNVRAEAQ